MNNQSYLLLHYLIS